MTKRRDPLMSFNFTVSLLPSPDSGNGAAVGTMVLTTSGIRATAGFSEASGLEMRNTPSRNTRPAASTARCSNFPAGVSWSTSC